MKASGFFYVPHSLPFPDIYRPQGKVMFSEASLCSQWGVRQSPASPRWTENSHYWHLVAVTAAVGTHPTGMHFYYHPQVGARLCFHRRVWFCSHGGVCLSACWDTTPPGADTPQDQTSWDQTPPRTRHPPEQTPPRADTPWEQKPPPGADTPLDQTPPRQTPPRADTPPHRACWEIRSMHGWYASYWNAILFI